MTRSNLQQAAIQYLRGLQQAGITDLSAESEPLRGNLVADITSESDVVEAGSADRVAESTSAYQSESEAKAPSKPAGESPPSSPALFVGGAEDAYGPAKDEAERIRALEVLNQRVVACERCPDLANCRTQTVFGVGNPKPRLAFFGEGPGADEDRLGEPFVGRAGQLLNKIIEACKMSRQEVYIFNTVKCRPPGNRNPHDSELENCQEYWQAQLEILQPEFICCLGSVAARTLLNTKDSVGRMRRKFHDYRGSKVIVTYHPAYLLRTPEAKAKTWDDMKMLMDAMGIQY